MSAAAAASSGSAAAAASSTATATAVAPMPPTTPKPANLPVNLRYKFVNYSIGSLTTAMETRDNIEDIPNADSDSESGAMLSDSGADSDSASDSECEDQPRTRQKGCSSNDVSPKSCATAAHATADELDDTKADDAASEADTDDLSRSDCSERDVVELDEILKENELGTARQPLVKIEEGILPEADLPRCPPISWLRAAGYDVPGSKGFDAAPVAPVCGERPTRYLNLFGRQMLARTAKSDLTVGSLTSHEQKAGHSRHIGRVPPPRPVDAVPGADPGKVLAQHGEWLEAFIAKARAVPLCNAAESLVGEDLGADVAAFLDTLSDGSDAGASVAAGDLADGSHVSGQRVRTRPVHRGRGRAGFHIDVDATASTPGRSQSPQPQRAPPPLVFDQLAPPLLRGPSQPFSQRRAY